MKKSGASQGQPASKLISERIAELGDWRGKTLSRMRKLIKEADPGVIEEWKWRGVPVWSHDGIICTGESYKSIVKLTFAKGASLKDPARLFNSSLEGNTRRAIDIHEGEAVDGSAFKSLVRQAIALNMTNQVKRICQKHGITINWMKSGKNRANRKQRAIWITEITDSGDFAAALHEIGHVMRDPEDPPGNYRSKLDAEFKAWQWALDYKNGDFDLPGWNRLHKSLRRYFAYMMDVSHPAYQLLVKAEERDSSLHPRVASFGAPQLTFGSKKPKPE
jgi:hypothetical protein